VLMEISVTEQRYQAVLAVLGGVPVTEVASRFGVGRLIPRLRVLPRQVRTGRGRHAVERHDWRSPRSIFDTHSSFAKVFEASTAFLLIRIPAVICYLAAVARISASADARLPIRSYSFGPGPNRRGEPPRMDY